MKPTDAIVVAAGQVKDPELAAAASNGPKSLIPVNGRPAVSYVVENLRKCSLISRIILVCDEPTFSAVSGADVHVVAHDDSTEVVVAAIREAQDAQRCLIMSGDMPLATSEAITDFLTGAPEADVIYPVVGKADVRQVYPERAAYYVETKEGPFTGSSCLLFRPSMALSRERLLMKLLNARKDPRSLLSLIGPGLVLKFMVSTLSLREFEQHLSRAMDLDVRVFISHFPELLLSIDSITDIALIERELSA